jgi:predicted protein tyrosine phosphatase
VFGSFVGKSPPSPSRQTLCPILGRLRKMTNRPNILVVCGRNKKRSRTAEHIFKNDNRFNIRSAGLSPKSDRKISENDLNWADLVFVMENGQRAKIWGLYRHLELPEIEILNIPDEYEFMNEELVEILTERINSTLKINYQL